MHNKLLAVLLVGLLAGCWALPQPLLSKVTIAQPQLVINSQAFSLLPVPDETQVFGLREDQKQHFLTYYYAAENQDTRGHRRLYNYLEEMLQEFHFQGETYTASQAITHQSGNCLSLAILTTALAQTVSMEVSYRRVHSAPVYQRFHNVMTLSSHVRTHLYDPDFVRQKATLVLFRPQLIIDYFPQSGNIGGDKISQEDFISMFYQNMAGDALVKQNYDLVFSYLNEAQKWSAYNPDTLNTLGVLYKKVGDTKQAEYIYKFAMQHTKGSVNILRNYVMLLEEQGRIKEAKKIEAMVGGVDDDNPYRWYYIANNEFVRANYWTALKYYKRAVKAAPYLHEGYFGLAKTYHRMDMKKQAENAIRKAIELSYEPKEQFLYRAKLRILKEIKGPPPGT